jgi:hypothetical protein
MKREIKFRGKVVNQSLFDRLCSRAGFGDLKSADRSGDKPLQRQAIWYVMREQGVTFKEIAEQSHRTHGTVVMGVKRFKGYLSTNYGGAVQIYQNIIKVAQNEKE